MIRPLFAAASAFGLVLAAPPALAGSADNHIVVEHADLNLSTAQGMAELDRRIDRAARKVCTVSAKTGTMLKRLDQDCYASAVSSVRQQVALAAR
jgi:UrcA family protein